MSVIQPYSIYRRSPDSPWWVRFSIRGQGQIRLALGTTDPDDAKLKAHELWFEAHHKAKLGLNNKAKPFAVVAEEFIKLLQDEAKRGERRQFQVYQYIRIIERYFLGFFHNRRIGDVENPDIVRYLEWRANYWISGPGKDIRLTTYIRNGVQIRKPITHKMRKAPSRGTISQEAVLLRMLFKQASKWGYIKLHQIPDIEVKPVLPNPRPTFDIDEFKILEQVSLQRVIEPRLNRNVRRDRTLLHCHLMIASFTGMRPTELKNLNWGDILRYSKGRLKAIGDRDLRIRARGKGKSRTLIPMLAALPFFDLLWDLWVIDHGTEPDDSFPVFSSLSGKRIESQKKGLNELLKAAGLIADFLGVKRTSYSFRHFYITQQLMAGVDVFLVAKNTGTSPQMIDKFYGHVKLELMANELRPAWKARS